MSQVKLSNIVKEYDGGARVIHGIDLDIADGEFVVFVGPSGCGKSTLLRMIAGLEGITGGELHIGDTLANDVAPAKRGLAMVFQSYALYPHMSVYENMAFSLKLAGMKRLQVEQAVQQAANVLQISHLLQRKPKDLSGGQRQRVAIGRAIVREPAVFLFDEPLSNLDASLRVQMRIELSRLHQELKTTMIYVTHDQVEAMTLGQRIVVFNAGRIEQVGTPLDLYDNPGNLFVAGFLGAPKMNFLKAEVFGVTADGISVRLAGVSLLDLPVAGQGLAVGGQISLGIRAEHIRIAPAASADLAGVVASVELVEHLGDSLIVYARLTGEPNLLAVKLGTEAAAPKAGDTVKICLPPQRCHVFDADGKACRKTPAAIRS
ncbi:sn-glycerol-3-phosphate ABC transporter ATP-binding protein UgpC [Undibacterium sp.]|uniref:ABC transporter ATP-binding protein n=1 Tax=Undibacterium sp. TaxID=1914977 RepID=UPI002C683644|nr:sn-glycerol-3-phosphate ABC transporter ATP-binding protein UgpC [Undibacterium sp.]HTD02435.1 sn-glycerol-3-phosphate ABC transporter ATP-binding protein UgpC [Undibacterium sp.]